MPSKGDNSVHSPFHNPDNDKHGSLLAWLGVEKIFPGLDVALFHQKLSTRNWAQLSASLGTLWMTELGKNADQGLHLMYCLFMFSVTPCDRFWTASSTSLKSFVLNTIVFASARSGHNSCSELRSLCTLRSPEESVLDCNSDKTLLEWFISLLYIC